VLAGRCAAGDCGATLDAAFEDDVSLDGWVSTGVQNFACLDRDDLGHIAPITFVRVIVCDDAMVHPVVQLSAAVDGNGLASERDDGLNEFEAGISHQRDSSKGMRQEFDGRVAREGIMGISGCFDSLL
jgi:hypothetical protein